MPLDENIKGESLLLCDEKATHIPVTPKFNEPRGFTTATLRQIINASSNEI